MKALLGPAILMYILVSEGCIAAHPRIFVGEHSPDGGKYAYVKEYYASMFQYPVSVYPKYSLVVQSQREDHEVYKITAKEFPVRFALVAWTDDSEKVGFYLESWGANSVVRAFDTKSGNEIPFHLVEAAARKQMADRWSRFIPAGADPLTIAEQPSEELSRAFYNWRFTNFEKRPGDRPRLAN